MKKRLVLILAAIAVAMAVPLSAQADHNRFLRGFDSAAAYGDTVTFKTQLIEPTQDCGGTFCPVSNRQVDFYVNGAYIGTDLTNSGGYAYLNDANQIWHVGTHAIVARYDRDNNAAPATVASTLTISKETSVLAARKGYLEAQLLDDDNVPMSGFAVHFHVTTPNGEQDLCTAFTDAAGNARCALVSGAGLSALNDPNTTYHATFDGTADYTPDTSSSTLV